MSSYSSQTVAQLKEVLKSRGLSIAGVKSDLVARLEELDKSAEVVEPVLEPVVEEPVVTEAVLEPEPVKEVEAPVVTESLPVAEPELPKELSPEEKKNAAIELLMSKIKRAQKFGDETNAKLYELELKRIEKFGLNLSSDTAFELGFGIRDKNFINQKRHRGNNNHGRHRNSKNKNKNRQRRD